MAEVKIPPPFYIYQMINLLAFCLDSNIRQIW